METSTVTTDLIQPIKDFLTAEPIDHIRSDKRMPKKAAWLVLIGSDIYKMGYLSPLLKCLSKEQAKFVMKEIHHGVCALHWRHWTMAT